MKRLFNGPWDRLAGRALAAGVSAGLVAWQQSDGSSAAWVGVGTAVLLAVLEVLTPINKSVGVAKQP